MKKIINYSICFLVLAACWSCKKSDGYNEIVSKDGAKPGVVTNVKVTNFNGGAYITYDLPASGNVLYVLADYKINDKTTRQTKSSYYTDTIKVEGFAKVQDYEVVLHAVSRADVMSDEVKVTVHPDTPAYLLVRPSVEMNTDFGGVNINVLNPLKKPIGVIFMAYDSTEGRLMIQDQHYANLDTINYSVRGYGAVLRQFGVYITDQYGNVSDTLMQTITPLFETLLDKSKFFTYRLNSDSPIGYGWELSYMWDNRTDGSSSGWHTNPGGIQPMVATFGLGTTAKLSRFIMWERPDQWVYGHGNPKNFSIWTSNVAAPVDVQLPKNAPVGTVLGDWTNSGNFKYPDPPSGLQPGFTNEADKAFVSAGVNFNFPSNGADVKFVRFCVSDTWSGGDFAHIMEISFYGKPL
ncbi:MAG TPA: DUF5000 domain-containing lipoprotein [Chitinophagaceae bacterium]|nr:DUF5000 domain-containing lipoprotein [Chitinophagaceae bacterium]